MSGRKSRGRPWWRTALDAIAVVAITVVIAGSMDLLPGSLTSSNMRVVDGDSLRQVGENAQARPDIRLEGIDAPELQQRCQDATGRGYACGRKARAHLRALVGGQEVSCRTLDVDRYQRSISICHAGEVNLNQQMVADGWAVAFRGGQFAGAERLARKARKGMWAGRFDRPQDWRRLHKSDLGGAAREPD